MNKDSLSAGRRGAPVKDISIRPIIEMRKGGHIIIEVTVLRMDLCLFLFKKFRYSSTTTYRREQGDITLLLNPEPEHEDLPDKALIKKNSITKVLGTSLTGSLDFNSIQGQDSMIWRTSGAILSRKRDIVSKEKTVPSWDVYPVWERMRH